MEFKNQAKLRMSVLRVVCEFSAKNSFVCLICNIEDTIMQNEKLQLAEHGHYIITSTWKLSCHLPDPGKMCWIPGSPQASLVLLQSSLLHALTKPDQIWDCLCQWLCTLWQKAQTLASGIYWPNIWGNIIRGTTAWPVIWKYHTNLKLFIKTTRMHLDISKLHLVDFCWFSWEPVY